jgi:hypothetical protein
MTVAELCIAGVREPGIRRNGDVWSMDTAPGRIADSRSPEPILAVRWLGPDDDRQPAGERPAIGGNPAFPQLRRAAAGQRRGASLRGQRS